MNISLESKISNIAELAITLLDWKGLCTYFRRKFCHYTLLLLS